MIREVADDTGITVTNVRYLGSQPWPMPRSLMLGFRADAPAGQAISVDHDELAEAYWFSRDALAALRPASQPTPVGPDRPAHHEAPRGARCPPRTHLRVLNLVLAT